jgi:predicted nucleic acid-binding Zn ribbon protein
MNAKSVQCPSCGKHAAGKYCSNCGAPIMSTCPACDSDIKPGSRVCHECGESLEARPASKQWSAQMIAPWIAIGIATIALCVALLSWFGTGDHAAAPAPTSSPMTSMSPASDQPVDLASMSPREAANRLFNRVMIASESGNTAEALKFAPMALQAYVNLGTLDNDARYHVALIHMTTGDIDGARVQLEMLRQSVPNHLLAYMLEHQIAERSGKKDIAARAYKGFLAAYGAEIATGREEYQDHRVSIERFREAAQASMAGKK